MTNTTVGKVEFNTLRGEPGIREKVHNDALWMAVNALRQEVEELQGSFAALKSSYDSKDYTYLIEIDDCDNGGGLIALSNDIDGLALEARDLPEMFNYFQEVIPYLLENNHDVTNANIVARYEHFRYDFLLKDGDLRRVVYNA